MPTCDCIEKVNKQLAEKGLALKLHQTISFGDPNATEAPLGEALAMETIALKKGAKPIKLFLAFCPFCGAPDKEAQEKKADPVSKRIL